MIRLSLRVRFALLAALLVLVVASLVGLGGYLTLRHSLFGQADRRARTEAHRLAGLIDFPSLNSQAQGNRVDVTDTALTHELSGPGLVIEINRPDGSLIQASPPHGRTPPLTLPLALRSRCLTTGSAHVQLARPPVALACERVGVPTAPLATLSAAAPLGEADRALQALRDALGLGVLGGAALAALLALLAARRAVRPIRQIADTAETIRAGDLGERIDYRGGDELGALAGVLDACFAELEEALERQRRFGADASHELKTPLAAIRTNVEILRRWAATEPAAREAALASLDQASRRATRLVTDLLYLANVEREPSHLRVPVRLDEVVISVVRETAPLNPAVSIRIARLDEATVSGDSLSLQQLLVNLLDNALNVSPPNAEVIVALQARAGNAVVSISDEGPGIAPDQLERIFDRFYRGGARSPRTGAGLGLAIARTIARDHAGDLTACNREPHGAQFELTLPLDRSRRTKRAERGTSAGQADLDRLSVSR